MTNYSAAVSNEEGYLTIPERLVTDELEFRMIGYNTLIVLAGHEVEDEVHLVKSLVGIGEVLISTDKSVLDAEDSLLLRPKYIDHVRSLEAYSGDEPFKYFGFIAEFRSGSCTAEPARWWFSCNERV